MPSVREIAKHSGVSISTVSRVLNNHKDIAPETRQKVLFAANEIGYKPASQKAVDSKLIGLVYFSSQYDQQIGAYDATLINGIMKGLKEMKYDLAIVDISQDKSPDETYTQFFHRKQLHGVILRTTPESKHLAEAIANEGFTSVVASDRFEHPNVNYIGYDSSSDSKRAIAYLINLGHRRIALGICNTMTDDHIDRYEAYCSALSENDIELDDSLVIRLISDIKSGESAVNQLMALPDPPTAIYFTNPLSTLGGLRRAHELGINVPNDLSIIGFDDSDARHMAYPIFTAVCQDAEDIGFRSAHWLTHHLNRTGVPKKLREAKSTVFEVNQTTAPPRKAKP
ncbi:LacI family DNA-binding transcriptional regulator [Planctomycetota bacterium]|nr:LacI family DNA-binding transcriptional regulator [Planctomycetota bacterium]